MSIEVGDRVIGTSGNIYGKKGTVIDIMNDCVPYGVKFDERILCGHDLDYDGNGAKCDYGYGYWCNDYNIKLLEKHLKFKVGDRVKAIKPVGIHNRAVDVYGTIKCLYDEDTYCIYYGVEFDSPINGHNISDYIKCKDGHGWYCKEYEIELVFEEDKTNEEETSTLKDFLKINNIVEISCYGEKRLGIVLDNKKIKTTRGYHLISSYDDDLTNYNGTVTNQSIDKIYENTDEGLKLIWDRKDYIDWSNVEVDTKIQVKCSKEDEWENRYFAKVEDGIVYAFSNGGTSFTCGESKTSPWDFARLYEEEL